MHLSIELELLLLALGLYLLDCLMLLAPGEGLLVARKADRWSLSLGSRHARFRGRTLVCLPLFSLHRPVLRIDWIDAMGDAADAGAAAAAAAAPTHAPAPSPSLQENAEVAISEHAAGLAAHRQTARRLTPLVYGIAAAQFVLFPLMLFVLRTPLMVGLTLALLYGQELLAIGWLLRHHDHLSLTRRASLNLALECLLCPPVALNLVRRVSLSIPDQSEPIDWMQILRTSDDWPMVQERMMEELAELLDAEDPASDRYRQLNERRATLARREYS